MFRRLLIITTVLSAWSCTDAAQPVAPDADVASSALWTGEVDAAAPQPAHRGVILVEAYIDGRSTLRMDVGIINLIQWWHYIGAAPGRLGGADYPTRMGQVSYWFDWPDEPDRENRDCDCQSFPVSLYQSPFWFSDYDARPTVKRGRGAVSASFSFPGVTIDYDDTAFPGADWYTVSFDTRYPLQVQPWPNQSPYVVSLSKQKYVSLTLMGEGMSGLDDPANWSDFSLGNDKGSETGIALGPGGVPLVRVADMNGDTIDDAVVRFPISGLLYRGDASIGPTVLTVTAASSQFGEKMFIRGQLPVTFVP